MVNWGLIKKDKYSAWWLNSGQTKAVMIHKRPSFVPKEKIWAMRTWNYKYAGTPWEKSRDKGFPTRQQALKSAHTYMKRH